MENSDLSVLSRCPLFDNIGSDELSRLLKAVDAKTVCFAKNETIIFEGDFVSSFGIVLYGTACIFKNDYSGNRNLLAFVGEADIFAEAYVCARTKSIPVSVASACESRVMFIKYDKLLALPDNGVIINNLLKIVSRKNVMLNEKIRIISKRTIREKILSYLYMYAQKTGSSEFDIPLNRRELADFLCVDRSAMSAQLSVLKKEGTVDTHKNHFILLDIGGV